MSKESKYSVIQVVSDLKRKGVRFGTEKVGGKLVNTIDKKNEQLGIKSLGKIDFLVNYEGYFIYR